MISLLMMPSKAGLFMCQVCKVNFSDASKFNEHLKSHTDHSTHVFQATETLAPPKTSGQKTLAENLAIFRRCMAKQEFEKAMETYVNCKELGPFLSTKELKLMTKGMVMETKVMESQVVESSGAQHVRVRSAMVPGNSNLSTPGTST